MTPADCLWHNGSQRYSLLEASLLGQNGLLRISCSSACCISRVYRLPPSHLQLLVEKLIGWHLIERGSLMHLLGPTEARGILPPLIWRGFFLVLLGDQSEYQWCLMPGKSFSLIAKSYRFKGSMWFVPPVTNSQWQQTAPEDLKSKFEDSSAAD
jgi:hypothetical protein